MSIISNAARVIRAGEEYSETNKKLRLAVWSFVKWFANQVEPHDLPASLGWRLSQDDDHHIHMVYSEGGSDSIIIITDWEYQKMFDIHRFCVSITGAEGNKLIEWLESITQERRGLLASLESVQKSFQAKIPGTPTLTAKEFAALGFPFPDAEVTFTAGHPAHAKRISRFLVDVCTTNHAHSFFWDSSSADEAYIHIFNDNNGCKACKYQLKAMLEQSKLLLIEIV